MAEFRYRTDLNPDHYQFRRSIDGFYPPREPSRSDRWGDRMILAVSLAVIVLLISGALA